MIRKAHVTCNFNCFIETERFLKVTGSDVMAMIAKSGARWSRYYYRPVIGIDGQSNSDNFDDLE